MEKISSDSYQVIVIPGIIQGRDETTNLVEAYKASKNGDTQAHYCIAINRTMVEEEWVKDRIVGAFLQKVFQDHAL